VKRSDPKPAKKSEIQRIVMDYIGGKVDSTRDFEDQTGISHAMKARYDEQRSMMSLDKLEHIFSIYPELKIDIAKYLSGNTDKNITQEQKKAGSSDNDVLLRNALSAILKKDNRIIELEAEVAKATSRPAKGTKQ
jgi:hypothetical protein